jgi:hypothetical protein
VATLLALDRSEPRAMSPVRLVAVGETNGELPVEAAVGVAPAVGVTPAVGVLAAGELPAPLPLCEVVIGGAGGGYGCRGGAGTVTATGTALPAATRVLSVYSVGMRRGLANGTLNTGEEPEPEPPELEAGDMTTTGPPAVGEVSDVPPSSEANCKGGAGCSVRAEVGPVGTAAAAATAAVRMAAMWEPRIGLSGPPALTVLAPAVANAETCGWICDEPVGGCAVICCARVGGCG